MHRRLRAALALLGLTVALEAGGVAPGPSAGLSPRASLGKTLFFDASLSGSGRLACASCHDPRNAYGPPLTAGPVMRGGVRLGERGLRAVPSIRYLEHVPRFARHLHVARHDEAQDVGPGGGLMWDGRVDRIEEQALAPLLDAREMANRDVHELAARLRASPEAPQLRSIAGAAAFADDTRTAAAAAQALASFELEDQSFHPYDSRYDDYLRGTGQLTAQELRGLALFNSAAKGNCAECHPSTPGPSGRPPEFTDHRFAALGVPRNAALVANADRSFHDLGLCGPYRRDLVQESAEYCGLFRTPSLRNAARRAYFFHNGTFTSLEQVVRFYVTRDLEPSRWYAGADGRVQRYDDLPARYRQNVDRTDPPFDRRPGQAAALTEAEIADVVAFLRTLADRS